MNLENLYRHRGIARLAGLPRLAGLAAGAMLTSCVAVGPDYRSTPLEAPAQWSQQHGGDPSLQAPAAATAALPADRWAVYGDATLKQLQDQALAANADVRTAALHVLQARAEERTATAQRGPQFKVQGAVARQRQSEVGAASRLVGAIGGANSTNLRQLLAEPFTLYDAGFDASWEPDLWGRVLRAEEAAHASTTAQAALLRQAQLGLRAEVARAYFQLRLVQRQQGLMQQQLAAAAQSEALLDAQQRNGLADQSGLLRQQAQRAALAAVLPTLRAQEAQAMNQLTLLCAQGPGKLNALLAAEMNIAATDAPTLPDLHLGLPADLTRHRPDIAAAEARLHVATANVGLAVADLYPRIVLGASFGFESVGSSEFGEWGSRQWTVGPTLSLPLFDRGRRRSVIELRQLQQQEAAVNLQQTALKAWHEVDDDISTYVAETQRQTELEGRAAIAAEALRLAQSRQQQGLTSELPVLSATADTLEAQRDLADSTARRQIALAALYKALGD